MSLQATEATVVTLNEDTMTVLRYLSQVLCFRRIIGAISVFPLPTVFIHEVILT